MGARVFDALMQDARTKLPANLRVNRARPNIRVTGGTLSRGHCPRRTRAFLYLASPRSRRFFRSRPARQSDPRTAPALRAVHLALGATRVDLSASQVDAVPIPPRCLRSRRTQTPNMPKPTGEGGP
jgi:hypothetical protein